MFGGCFDVEFETASEQFFREVREGRFVLVVSDLTVEELADAPENVRSCKGLGRPVASLLIHPTQRLQPSPDSVNVVQPQSGVLEVERCHSRWSAPPAEVDSEEDHG